MPNCQSYQLKNPPSNQVVQFDDPDRKCEKMTVTVPKITCEDETTELCQDVPHIVEGPETLEQCKVNVGEAKCSEVELVLPKQVTHREYVIPDRYKVLFH